MTDEELLERVWIAAYAAAYVQYSSLYKGRPVDALKRTQHAWIQAGDAVEDLIYSTWCVEGSQASVPLRFKNAIKQCREGALRRFYRNQLSE